MEGWCYWNKVKEDNLCILYYLYKYFFLCKIKLEKHRVLYMQANHLPELSFPAFQYLFGGLSQAEVIAKFTQSEMILLVANIQIRIINKQLMPIYVNKIEDNKVLFHLSVLEHLLMSINHNTSSDLKDNDLLPPKQNTCNINMLTNLFC